MLHTSFQAVGQLPPNKRCNGTKFIPGFGSARNDTRAPVRGPQSVCVHHVVPNIIKPLNMAIVNRPVVATATNERSKFRTKSIREAFRFWFPSARPPVRFEGSKNTFSSGRAISEQRFIERVRRCERER